MEEVGKQFKDVNAMVAKVQDLGNPLLINISLCPIYVFK